ncbi:mucin-13b isoform X3 [Coregonus clupeaformis]|uniref:mucin-13b isoform X3 n=1 Tax=Coregonus clupeaformis TaxID=59861 RepID=UPI001E1C6926|nr:mucin-13b isoform X3 [Coregonus clupeaformis]
MSKMFVVRLILFFCLAVAVFGQTPTTAPTASTESPTTKDPTPTTKDTAATPTTNDTAATPTTKDTAATPTTNDTAATPTTKDTAATPTTKDTAATPTTKDTAATPTTNDTAATPTTKDPAATPTTKDPAATPTTKDPTATPTTKDTAATPTTKDPSATPTTKDPAATPTTKDTAATPTTKDPATTTTPNPCDSNPCNGGSSCQPGYVSHFTCLCIAGQTYSEASGLCEEAKVFPGSLTLTNLLFNEEMNNSASKQFNETAATFIDLMEKVFENHIGYIDSTVLKLSRMSEGSARTFWSRESAGVSATMENNFKLNSVIDETIIKGIIENAIQDCKKGGAHCLDDVFIHAKYKEAKQCESSRKPCEDTSTICNSVGGRPKCDCRTGYVKTEYSIRTCKACESGKADGNVCHDCSFGYSGLNCSESWKLILVIVGTVLGALLLVTLILLPVVARKTPKKSSSKKSSKNAEVPTYTSPYPAKDFRASALTNGGVTNASSGFAGVPKIPRAMPNNNSSWDRGSNLEMTESGSRQALVTRGDKGGIGGYQNPDDTRSFNTRNPYQSRGQGSNPYQSGGQGSNPYQSGGQGSNPYQSGGQGSNPYQRGGQGSNPYQSGSQGSNPYQSRPQDDNPYQSQGQDNPYFTHDNGRRN